MKRLLRQLMTICLLLAGTMLSANWATAAILAAERDALIALYTSTNGASWTDNTGWNGSVGSECSWFGVTCDVGENTVIELHLPNNNLVGTIPVNIESLTNLRVLNLRVNQLSGNIPAEIRSLTSLRVLNLRSNALTGNIPAEIGYLTNLQELYLRSNELSGEIPVQLESLTNLLILSLRSNRLTGSIPSEIGTLTNLQELYLRSNILVGEIPANFINLTNLIVDGLNLRYNAIHTDDATLASQLNAVHAQEGSGVRDFSLTQTMDADGVVVTSVGDTDVELGWNEVSYTNHDGGYRIYRSTNANSGFTMVSQVTGKATVSASLTGLDTCTTYFVRVNSYTDAHPGNATVAGNKSEVESDGLTGNVVEFTTTGCPVVDPDPAPPATGGGGGGCTVKAGQAFDPLLLLMMLAGAFYIHRNRYTQFRG